MSNKDEMQRQLGMNPSTAANALRKEVIFSLVKQLNQDICFHCGKKITTVKELSIEHKIPWLHTENPKECFFDLENIAFSHLDCNRRAGRKPNRIYSSPEEQKRAATKRATDKRLYDSEKRKAQYRRTGK